MERLSAEELSGWKRNATTRKVLARIEEAIRAEQENIGAGRTLNRADAGQTQGDTAFAVGRIAGMREALEVEADEEKEPDGG